MIYLLSRLTLHITNNLLGLSNNLINNLLRLGPRLLDCLDVGAGCLLWCSRGRGLSRSRLLSSGSRRGSFGLSDATRGYFAGAGLGRVGFGGGAAFCGRDCVFDLLDETGLGVAFGKRLVFCYLVGKCVRVWRRGWGSAGLYACAELVGKGGRLTSSRACSRGHFAWSEGFE